MYVNGRIAEDICAREMRQTQGLNATFMNLSVCLGLYAFGLKGVLYGPVGVVLGTILYRLTKLLAVSKET